MTEQPDETMELDFCTCGRQYFQHTDRELLACMRRDLLKAGERYGLTKPVCAAHLDAAVRRHPRTGTMPMTDEERVIVQQLVEGGLATDGAHHKQWYLQQIAYELGLEIPFEYEPGTAP